MPFLVIAFGLRDTSGLLGGQGPLLVVMIVIVVLVVMAVVAMLLVVGSVTLRMARFDFYASVTTGCGNY